MTRVLDHAGAALIGCKSFADEVSTRLGTDPSRFTIVPGAVDTNRFVPVQHTDCEKNVLLYHGRIDARKGAMDLLQAARILADENMPFSLIYSGIGPDFERVARGIVDLDLSAQVQMTGYVDYQAVPNIYHQASIFVSPTYAEGFSNTILEAMASGLTCVSCRAVGVVDCLRDGENGLLTEPGDVAGLAASLRRLLADPELRKRLAAAGLEECRRLYSWKSAASQIIQAYTDVIDCPLNLDFPVDLPSSPCRFRSEPHLL